MTYTKGIDVSGYQEPDRMNYAELKAHGFGFVVVKVDQYLTEDHVTLARSAGLEVGGYYWNDPLSAPEYQARRIVAEARRLGLRFVALDVEQFWSDWDAYWRWMRREINLDALPKFSPAAIAANAQVVLELVQAELTIPVIIYTGDWFVSNWAAPMLNWMMRYQSWIAQYIDYGETVHNKTWVELDSLPGAARLLPVSGSICKIWQVSGSYVYPGRSWWDAYDTNLFLGSADDLQAWLGAVPPAPGFISYQVRSTARLGLRIRNEPNLRGVVVGKIYPGNAPVTIVEERDGWGRFSAGWISLAWTRKV